MENKTSVFKEYINPILVLVLICFAVTFLLAFTYGVTAPIIAKNTAKAASEARMELLEAADNFTDSGADLVVLEEKKVYATECYTAPMRFPIFMRRSVNLPIVRPIMYSPSQVFPVTPTASPATTEPGICFISGAPGVPFTASNTCTMYQVRIS